MLVYGRKVACCGSGFCDRICREVIIISKKRFLLTDLSSSDDAFTCAILSAAKCAGFKASGEEMKIRRSRSRPLKKTTVVSFMKGVGTVVDISGTGLKRRYAGIDTGSFRDDARNLHNDCQYVVKEFVLNELSEID